MKTWERRSAGGGMWIGSNLVSSWREGGEGKVAEKAKGSCSVEERVNVVTDKSTMKKFRAFVEKEKGRLSESEKAEIRALERKALDLWKLGVKARAGGRCEFPGCKKIKFLNAHHIERYTTNRTL